MVTVLFVRILVPVILNLLSGSVENLKDERHHIRVHED